MSKRHDTDYDQVTTARCERALVTLLGDIGPWSERVYLVGGLAPRYIVGSLPRGSGQLLRSRTTARSRTSRVCGSDRSSDPARRNDFAMVWPSANASMTRGST